MGRFSSDGAASTAVKGLNKLLMSVGNVYVVDDLKFIPRYLAHRNLAIRGVHGLYFSSDSPQSIDIGLRHGQIKAALLKKLLMWAVCTLLMTSALRISFTETYQGRSWSIFYSAENILFHVSFTSHNIHYITPVTRHCKANNLPSTEQAVKTQPKQDKSFSFIFDRFWPFICCSSVVLWLDKGDFPENLHTACPC